MKYALALILCLWLVTYPQPIPAADPTPTVQPQPPQPSPPKEEVRPLVILTPQNVGQPKASINAPQSARVGDMVKIDGYQSTNVATYKWIIHPEGTQGLEVFPDGRRALFSNHDAGEYLIILAVASADGGVDVAFHRIMVGEALVPPGGQEAEDSSSPPEKNAASIQQVQQVPYSTLIATLALKFDRQQAGILAGTMRQAQSLIRLDNPDESYIEDHDELIKVTEDLARKALGNTYPTWEPLLQRVWQSVPKDGNLGQDKAVWQELAKGLEALSQGNVK